MIMENTKIEMCRRWPAVCVDVETLGTLPTAGILEIGAVCFDPVSGEVGPYFVSKVSMSGQKERTLDFATLKWWVDQERGGLRMPLAAAEESGNGLTAVKLRMVAFMAANTDPQEVHVWAWGMDFDFPILRDAFGDHGMWRHYNQRCARTLCAELGVKREGMVVHRAVADALQEARAVIAAMRKIEDDAPVERGKPDFAGAWEEYRTQLRDTAGYPLPDWDEAPEEVREAFALAGWKLMEGKP